MTKSTWHILQSTSHASPDRLIILDSLHHGESNGLEYVSTEVQNFLTSHSVSASPTTQKLTESCIHCHSNSCSMSTYQRTCFMVKELEKLAHSHKFTGPTTCFINRKQLFEKVVGQAAVVLVLRPSWRNKILSVMVRS